MMDDYRDSVHFRIAEIFASYQGEGINTGKPAVFIRLHGCDKNCEWCDTDEKMKIPPVVMSLNHVKERVYNAAAIKGWRNFLVVITGGEPTLQSVSLLIQEFSAAGFPVAMETNGSRLISEICFVSYSPKSIEDLQTPNGKFYTQWCGEIKLIIGGVLEPAKMIQEILSTPNSHCPIWLQPLNNSNDYVPLAESLVHFSSERIRIGHQIHKFRRWE